MGASTNPDRDMAIVLLGNSLTEPSFLYAAQASSATMTSRAQLCVIFIALAITNPIFKAPTNSRSNARRNWLSQALFSFLQQRRMQNALRHVLLQPPCSIFLQIACQNALRHVLLQTLCTKFPRIVCQTHYHIGCHKPHVSVSQR